MAARNELRTTSVDSSYCSRVIGTARRRYLSCGPDPPPLPSTPDTRQDNVDGFVVVKVSTNGVTNGMLYEYVLGRCSCHTSSVRQTIGRSSVRRERIHNEAAHKSRFRKGNTCLESVSGKPKSKWDSFHLDDAMHTHHGSASCHH